MLGTRDGRDVVAALGELYDENRLGRMDDGRYTLIAQAPTEGTSAP